jgi:hypothetical protein
MHILCNIFGNPCDVAEDHTYVRKDYKGLVSWLRCAEAMMRRLLLIEAAAYVETLAAPVRARQRKPRQRRLVTFYPDKPEDWRVCFRSFQSSPACGGSVDARGAETKGDVAPSDRFAISSPASGGEKRFFDAWPLALRYEALVRVFNNPVPFAKRLARKLRAKPQRIRDVLRAPPEAVNRIDDFERMGERAEAAWPAPNTG